MAFKVILELFFHSYIAIASISRIYLTDEDAVQKFQNRNDSIHYIYMCFVREILTQFVNILANRNEKNPIDCILIESEAILMSRFIFDSHHLVIVSKFFPAADECKIEFIECSEFLSYMRPFLGFKLLKWNDCPFYRH